MTSSISRAKLTGSGFSSSLPASIFERSSISLMRLRRWVPAAFTRRNGSSAFSVPKRAALVTIISVSPIIAFSGVRNSWLILARNCDLCSLASASCRLLSWISSNSRTFSIAIAAWSANVLTSSISLLVNGRTSARDNVTTPIVTPSRNIGTPSAVRYPPNFCASTQHAECADGDVAKHHGHDGNRPIAGREKVARSGRKVRRSVLGVGNVHHPAIENGDPSHVLACERDRGTAPDGFGIRRLRSGDSCGPHQVSVRKCDHDPGVCEEPEPALHNGFEYRLRICGGTADHSQNLGSRRLPLQRLPGLVEQPHVLDRDHRLVGESRYQLDLLVGERLDDRASEHEHADRNALAHQGNRQIGPVAAELLEFSRRVTRIGQHIVNVDRPAFHRRSSGDRPWARRNWMLLRILLELAGEAEIRRDSVKPAAVPQVDECLVGLAQVGRGCDQRVENGLQVEGRAADDLEHVGGRSLLL